MEFGSASIRRIKGNAGQNYLKLGEEADESQLNLSMYLHPHTETISIEEFQSLAKQRLAVLRALELIREKHAGDHRKYAEAFKEEIGRIMPLFTNRLLAEKQKSARREDRISHFILRLAYCQSADMSDWFVRQETELFRMRFQMDTPNGVSSFLKANNIVPEEVKHEEKYSMLDDMSQALTVTKEAVLKCSIYKVDCWDVLDLFASYRLHLKDGFAYIAHTDLIALIAPQFRANIAASLESARRKLVFLQEEDRLVPLLKHVVSGGSAYRREFKDGNSEVALDRVDDLARESFPLCMRNIHFQLRREHHLRHYARQQYGLFLKGVGLSMEDSLEFFRMEFTQKMDNEQFSKQYAYNIRHMYGKEGNRVSRNPLSCSTIILGNAPTALDCHGCPYKHMEGTALSKRLTSFGLDEGQISQIMAFTKMNRFDKACTKYFEAVHKIPELEELITHPNQYFALSRKAHRGELLTRTCMEEESMDDDVE